MDTRVLYVTAVVIAAISGGYYYYSGKQGQLTVNANQNMSYAARNIQLTQTDEMGQLYLRAKVERLQQDRQKQSLELNQLHAQMYENGQINASFYAKKANGYDDNDTLVLSEDVKAIRQLPNGQMQLDTTQLTIYPKRRELQTEQRVVVKSPQAEFVSQGLKANLNQGQYDFFNIRGTYEP